MTNNYSSENEPIPVYVLGGAHSGTTILYNMLALHPDVTWFSLFTQRGRIKNCGFRNPLTNRRFRIPFLHHYDKFFRKVATHKWEKIIGLHSFFYYPRPIEADHVWDYLIPRDGSLPPDVSVRRIKKVFDQEFRFWNKKYLLLKVPRLFSNIEILKEAYPKSKFIHIIRDGRAVSMSVRFKFMRYGESLEDGLYSAARYWVRAIESITAHKNSVDMIEFKYEDFCSDVHKYVQSCLVHTGISKSKFQFEKIPKTLIPSNYKWLEKINESDERILNHVQQSLLKQYQYIE